MKIKQTLVIGKYVYLFTELPETDIETLKTAYRDYQEYNKKYVFPLGYEIPRLTTFKFLGVDYPCLTLWFDNEDIPVGFKDKDCNNLSPATATQYSCMYFD